MDARYVSGLYLSGILFMSLCEGSRDLSVAAAGEVEVYE